MSQALPNKLAVALVSGGLDSPVAVARMLNAGWDIHCLHASMEPITGFEAELKTISVLEHLSAMQSSNDKWSGRINDSLTVIPVGDVLPLFTEADAHRDYFVHMKRLFNHLGCIMANQIGASHLLTGENLGQVSSQTLGNLGVIDSASSIPIHKPLLGFDKQEIMRMARSLGTFDLCKGTEECDALGPSHPRTVAKLGRISKSEELFGGIANLAERCWEKRRIKILTTAKLGG